MSDATLGISIAPFEVSTVNLKVILSLNYLINSVVRDQARITHVDVECLCRTM